MIYFQIPQKSNKTNMNWMNEWMSNQKCYDAPLHTFPLETALDELVGVAHGTIKVPHPKNIPGENLVVVR